MRQAGVMHFAVHANPATEYRGRKAQLEFCSAVFASQPDFAMQPENLRNKKSMNFSSNVR
jgi:hypothetical protein